MANAKRDENHITTMLGVSKDDSNVTIPVKVNPVTGRMLIETETGSVSDFTDLGDTPSSYTGQATKVVRVNSGEDGLEFATVSGTGDVVGPSSSIDDNIATFDGTTGKLIQDGGNTLSEVKNRANHTGDESILPFDETRTGDVNKAEIAWDEDKENFVFGIDGTTVPLNQPFWYIRNNTGAQLDKGTPVYATGTLGASGRITVGKFITNGTIDSKYFLGVLATNVANGADGVAFSQANLRKLDTTGQGGETWSDGDVLYISEDTAGTYTNVEPTSPNLKIPAAFVVYADATNGSLAIRVQPSFNLSNLNDIHISSVADKHGLIYNNTNSRWENRLLAISDITNLQTELDGKQDILSEGAFADGDKTKLDGIEVGAEVNNISDVNATDLTDAGDSALHFHSSDRNRSNHTGTQAASTITGTKYHTFISDYDTELAGKTNTTAFTPTADYHVATKKYVDDNAGGGTGKSIFTIRTLI